MRCLIICVSVSLNQLLASLWLNCLLVFHLVNDGYVLDWADSYGDSTALNVHDIDDLMMSYMVLHLQVTF